MFGFKSCESACSIEVWGISGLRRCSAANNRPLRITECSLHAREYHHQAQCHIHKHTGNRFFEPIDGLMFNKILGYQRHQMPASSRNFSASGMRSSPEMSLGRSVSLSSEGLILSSNLVTHGEYKFLLVL